MLGRKAADAGLGGKCELPGTSGCKELAIGVRDKHNPCCGIVARESLPIKVQNHPFHLSLFTPDPEQLSTTSWFHIERVVVH
jgi:hypothetical protein